MTSLCHTWTRLQGDRSVNTFSNAPKYVQDRTDPSGIGQYAADTGPYRRPEPARDQQGPDHCGSRGSVPFGVPSPANVIFSTLASACFRSRSQWSFKASPRS